VGKRALGGTDAVRGRGWRGADTAGRPGEPILVRLVASPVYLPEAIVSAAPTKPLRYAGTTKYDEVFLRRRIGLGTLITREENDWDGCAVIAIWTRWNR
jgi:hypothetical protein